MDRQNRPPRSHEKKCFLVAPHALARPLQYHSALKPRRSLPRPIRACHALDHRWTLSTVGMHSAASLELTVQCARQVPMGRPRGVGMARAKKKKVAVNEQAAPSQVEPAPAAQMPPPPPRPPQAAAAAAPDKELAKLVGSRVKETHKFIKRAAKLEQQALDASLAVHDKVKKIHDKVERIQKRYKAKPKQRDHNWELEQLHKTDMMIKKAQNVQLSAMVSLATAQRDHSRALCEWKDLQIARLQRGLRARKT